MTPAMMTALRACAQDHVLDTLTDTCTIQRRGKVSDGKGGFTITYTTLASGVACYVAPQSAMRTGEMVVAGKITSLTDYVVSFVTGQDVVDTDRIIWNGLMLEVVGTRLRTNAILLQVDTKEFK
jgi:hypothetical protein